MKLSGKNPVFERLRTNPKSIARISLTKGFKESAYVHKKAKQWGIHVSTVPESKMSKIGRNHNAQGIIAIVSDFEYLEYGSLLEDAIKRKRTLVFLDRLNDPQNLGAMIRSLACLGKFALILPSHESVSVTESVLRVACGGENFVPVSIVSNLKKAITKAQEKMFVIAGAVLNGETNLFELEVPSRFGIVIGSEQKGIREPVQNSLDLKLTIPMTHHTLSLNAAQTATIIAYEIAKQKSK